MSEFPLKGFITSWWECRRQVAFHISHLGLCYLKWTAHPMFIGHLSCRSDKIAMQLKEIIYFPIWFKYGLLFVLQHMKWCHQHFLRVFITLLIQCRNSSQIMTTELSSRVYYVLSRCLSEVTTTHTFCANLPPVNYTKSG